MLITVLMNSEQIEAYKQYEYIYINKHELFIASK